MWPWHRRTPPTEATGARRRAEKQLEQIKAETPKYQAFGDRLRQLREHNNFATAIEQSFRGGRP